jgi:glucose-6-phosphate 1-dehydrogenase
MMQDRGLFHDGTGAFGSVVLRGAGELFGRGDRVDAEWRLFYPIPDHATQVNPRHAGIWGPEEAEPLTGAGGPWRKRTTDAEEHA